MTDHSDHSDRPDNLPVDPLLSFAQVKRISSLSRSTIERNMKAGRFPRAIQITPGGRIGFRQSEILAWATDPMGWGAEIDF